MNRDDSTRQIPETDHLIQAYTEYSEEARYRDGLMHNSYYLIAVAAILLGGQFLSLEITYPVYQSPRVAGFLLLSAPIIFGIGIVMKAYNAKRVNAENQRDALELVLDTRFTETGMFVRDDHPITSRENDNPFKIQSEVVRNQDSDLANFLINKLSVGRLSTMLLLLSGISIVISAIIWIQYLVL